MIGVVTGLKSEIAVLEAAWKGDAFAYFAAGGSAARAAEAARRMATQGATLLISAGVAGALDPAARPGDLVLAGAVIAPDGRSYGADTAWRGKIAATLGPGARWDAPKILGNDAAVLNVRVKADLFRRTGAVAVDMESHGLAAAAASAGIPFIVLRVIADPAERAIPEAALAGMKPDGSVDPVAVLLRLFPTPWKLPGLLRLAAESRQAHEALGRVALAAGRVLAG